MGRGSEQTFFQRRQIDAQQAHEKVLNIINCQRNANQNVMRYHFTPVRIIKKTRNNKCQKAVEKREHFWFAFCGKIGTATVENSMEGPQKIKNRIVI